MSAVSLLFPHQLFQDHELYSNGLPIYLIEEHLFFREFNFHKQKLAFHRASMKYHQSFLQKKGNMVHYIDSTNPNSDIRELLLQLAQENIKTVHFVNPTDNWLEKRILEITAKNEIELIEYENPLFINTRQDLESFFKPGKKSFFQTTFYKQQRLKYNILIQESNQPSGGKWTFDADNRKKYPNKKTPPAIPFPENDKYWQEAISYVNKNFESNPGEISSQPVYPINKVESDKWLQQFFQNRFHSFGDYEDAIVQEQVFLHHSVLSPLLNTGLMSPMEVIEKSLAYADSHEVPINSLEGFIRQILGWREFIRGMYECKGTESRNSNFWKFKRKIPNSFYDGSTGIVPVDETIKKVLKYGYCHHIERLMVIGNFMLLCEFHPKEVYRWFMELFIDAYDWVMVPNVYGMSQFADSGLFATKPYISGSNYLMKMSNYKKGEWQTVWDGLFWRFMDIHRSFFLSNPRLGMLVRTFDKMDPHRKHALHKSADDFLNSL
jgi:deoxyribodipyrimidine photolyase-related protein